jgi:adenylate cyclase
MTPEDPIAESVRAALARGDLLTAYDEVKQGKEGGHAGLQYLEVLTLARLGDTDQALRLYGDYNIDALGSVDALSLKARLLKDQAFSAGVEPDQEKLLSACAWYSAVYRQTRSSYPAINAATLAQIAGRTQLAAGLARAVVKAGAQDSRQDYFALATQAEALVVLGDIAGARAALSQAMLAPDADVGARSTTLLQLRRLRTATADTAGVDSLLDLIRPPTVAMFCGNIFVHNPVLEARLAAEMSEAILREDVGFAYGALAAGSDILIAEQLLKAGAELHVVLPFTEADFLEQSVDPGGEHWVRRYHACMARATSVTFASNMSYVGEGSQFAYGSKVTMGMARLRARHLHGDAIQLAIVETAKATTLSGSDIGDWRASGGRSIVVTHDSFERPVMPPPPEQSHVARGAFGLMFTDYPGFTDLEEHVLPIFWKEIMTRAATMLRRFSRNILQSNTWGDALFVVFNDASSAAAAALDLCDEFKEVDCAALGVPEGTAMRVALHYGPTYVGHDPVTERTTYYGTEVSRAARIEPVTPPGSVYVTEPFAAVLEMEADPRFTCNYVGRLMLAKGYGVYPIYRLTRRPRDPAARAEA